MSLGYILAFLESISPIWIDISGMAYPPFTAHRMIFRPGTGVLRAFPVSSPEKWGTIFQ
jgi:hypothetical protein